MLMRHAHEYEVKPRGGLAKRIVAVLASVAMLSGMGYATSAALAEDTPATVETTTDQSATTANESTDGKNAADGTDADNAGDTATGTADTESDTNTGADADVNTANAANVGDATSSDANSQTDTTAQSNPQPVNAAQNSPSAVADVTGSNCIYAGTNALQRVCWLDMSKFNPETAKTNAGQKMTVNLGGGLTMSFIAHYSGNRKVVASGVPTWDERTTHPGEAGHHAIFGVEGYSDFPTESKPALYQENGYRNDSKIRLSDITIKNGQDVANLQYSFVMADAESTNQNEQMVYTSDSAITQLGFYPTDDSNYGFCKSQSSDADTTMTCTGKDGDGVPQGIRLYTTSTPTQVSIEMKNSGPGSRQGAAFGVIFSQAVAKITVNGLASGDTSATFRAGVSNDEVGSLESDSISSNTAESSTLPILASAGVSKTVRFYLEGNPSDWSKYDVTFEGTDNGKVVSSSAIQVDESERRYVDMTVAADHTVQGHFTVTAHPDPLGAPEHHKTIAKKNGANDTYTLNLNVTGKRSSTSQTVSQPVDIALVLDNSGSMSYNVKPTQKAYDEYAANLNAGKDGYDGVKGNANTDLPGNATSSNQPGFHANDSACLAYSADGVDHKCSENPYPHPVVQVVSSTLHIDKQWSGNGQKPESITVDIKQGNGTYKTVTLKRDDSGKWSTDVIIPAGAQKTYTVTEVEPDSHLWKASYQNKVGDGNLADGNAVTVPESTASQEATVIITNTLKQTMLTHAIGVQKELKGRDWKDSDAFTFKLKADGSNPDAPMPASCKNQLACTVTVKRDSSDDHVAYFGDITYDAGEAEYTYLVTENAGNASAMYYSQAEYRVVVSVMKDGTSGEWKAVVESVTQLKTDYGAAGSNWDETQPMLFTNQYISASSLPLTGRMGAERWWQIAAGGVGVLALLAVAAADQWRRKKRLS